MWTKHGRGEGGDQIRSKASELQSDRGTCRDVYHHGVPPGTQWGPWPSMCVWLGAAQHRHRRRPDFCHVHFSASPKPIACCHCHDGRPAAVVVFPTCVRRLRLQRLEHLKSGKPPAAAAEVVVVEGLAAPLLPRDQLPPAKRRRVIDALREQMEASSSDDDDGDEDGEGGSTEDRMLDWRAKAV